jgi:hypothetical protein
MEAIVQFVATFCCSLFTGAALYVSIVEHPARMECGTELAVTEFTPSYRRGSMMQATLAMVSFLFSLAAWLKGGNAWWLLGGILLISVVPFTLIIIMPTNTALMDSALDRNSTRAAQLLRRWGWLHAARTTLSVLSLVIFLLIARI